jgi:putative inorganic carbon (HCO3(-)) transporter
VVQGRVQGAFAQPNDFGEFSLLGATAAAALLAGSSTRSDRLLGSVGLLVSLAGIAVSFSRGTWLGALAALLTVAVLSPRLRAWAALLIGLIPVALLLGAALGAPPFPTLVARFVSLLTGGGNPLDDRRILFAQALRVFAAHPVLGVGPGGFQATNYGAESVLIRRTYRHGHSVLLTIAAEVGLIGAFALLAFTVALAAATLAARSRLLTVGDLPANARLAVLAAGLVGIAVHGLVDVVYMNPLLIPLAWLLAGLLAGETARTADQYPLQSSPRPTAPR